MTVQERDALNALELRVAYAAATTRLIGEHRDLPDQDFGRALRGIGETLDDVAARMQALSHLNS